MYEVKAVESAEDNPFQIWKVLPGLFPNITTISRVAFTPHSFPHLPREFLVQLDVLEVEGDAVLHLKW